MTWPVTPLADLADIQGGIQKQPKRAPRQNAHPFLRVANVTAKGLNLADVHSIELFNGELERYRLQRGDLLVVEGNGSASQIGRAVVWDGSIIDAVHQNHLIRIRPRASLEPRFLGLVWNAPSIRQSLTEISSSTSGLHTLSVAKLKRVMVPVPTLGEQRRIVDVLEDHLSRLDVAQTSLAASVRRLGALRESALVEAIAHAKASAGSTTAALGELSTVNSGMTPLRSNPRFFSNGTIPWITSGDLHQGVIRPKLRPSGWWFSV